MTPRSAPRLFVVALALGGLVLTACSSGTDDAEAPSVTSAATTPTTVVGEAVAESTPDGEAAFLGPVRTLDHDGLTVAYRQFGEGPNLLLIQGQASPMSLWPLSWLETVAEDHTVTMYDLRGLGLSDDDTSGPLRLEQLADDAAFVASSVASTPLDVFGLSTGGEIGLLLAVRHPEVVDQMVVSGASLGGPSTVEGDADLIGAFEDPATPPDELLGIIFPPGDPAISRFVADLGKVPQTQVSAESTERFANAENHYIDDPSLPERWRDIEAPVLVHNGEIDQLIPAVNAEQLADAIPDATALVTPGASHYAFYQEADSLLPQFESFWSA